MPVRTTTTTPDGANLVLYTERPAGGSHGTIAVCHGLGFPPSKKTSLNDEWTGMALKGAERSGWGWAAMDARGHGSTEWKHVENLWRDLGGDLAFVGGDAVAGQSMGAAASLEAVVAHPGKFSALILIRPPTMYTSRAAQQAALRRYVEKLPPGSVDVSVLRAAASTDLSFPLSQLRQVTIPTLILAVRDDRIHPIASAEILSAHIPKAELHIASTPAEAFAAWPAIIEEFLRGATHDAKL